MKLSRACACVYMRGTRVDGTECSCLSVCGVFDIKLGIWSNEVVRCVNFLIEQRYIAQRTAVRWKHGEIL